MMKRIARLTEFAFPQCLITGCDLYLPNEDKVVHGDLHAAGGSLIFNAMIDAHANPRWEYSINAQTKHALEFGPRNVISIDSNLMFERRGVMVFPALLAHINDAARVYLSPHVAIEIAP